MNIDYNNKSSDYFHNVREDILSLIPQELRSGNLLEIGAGGGDTLLFAKKNNFAKKTYGIELCEIDSPHIKSLDNFIIGNIENISLPYEKETFDVIICGDVLEHLIDPSSVLEKLKPFLKKDGVVITSLPNIREWKTLKQIIFKGDFQYTDSGVLDRTHLRFFAKKNMIELFENNGYKIKQIVPKDSFNIKRYFKQLRILKLIGIYFFEEFVTFQYFITAAKKD